jgi:regulator of PEP synthase PpsR (kinase-PPPase family)
MARSGDIGIYFHVHMISDSTGETLMEVMRASVAQFQNVRPIEHLFALVRSPRQLERALEHIQAFPGIVMFTLVNADLRRDLEDACASMGMPALAVLDPIQATMSSYLGAPVQGKAGAQRVLDADYYRRIEAMNYSMAHDDGQGDDLASADVILLGVSRTSKTPTSIYLGHRGMRTANIPLVPGAPLPEILYRLKKPLIVGPHRLARAHHSDPPQPAAESEGRPLHRLCGRGDGERRGHSRQALCLRAITGRRLTSPAARSKKPRRRFSTFSTTIKPNSEAFPMSFILASGSASRRAILENAQLSFEIDPADIDEGAVKDSFQGDPAALALKLAELKALEVSRRRPGALVLGSDQVLEFDGVAYDKARSVEEAEARLRQLRGGVHYLQGGSLWRVMVRSSGGIRRGRPW